MRALLLIAAMVVCADAADLKPVFAKNAAKPIGPYAPGMSAGAYFYVSGQGARDAAGKLPATFEEQTRQCLQNVKDILEAGGLGMENVVWAQVFAQDMKQLGTLDKVYASFFSKDPPARSMVVVNKMPGDTPVEIAVVAVRDLKQRKAVSIGTATAPVSNAVRVGERVYVSGVLGLDSQSKVPADPREQVNVLVTQMKAVLAKAGLEMRDMAYAHVYVDRAMPMKILGDVLTELLPSEVARTVTQTAGIPRGAHIEISGIASTKLKREGACTSVEDTIYCPSVSGAIEHALARVKENLKIANVDVNRVVVSNVFLDDIQHFSAMNKTYAGVFGAWLPTRVTLQPTAREAELNLAPSTNSPVPPSDGPRAQISVIAVR